MANSCTTEICEKVVGLMKAGLTLEEVCAQIGVTRKTLYNWRDPKGPHYEHEFAQAYELGKTYQAAWWLNAGRANLGAGKDFNTPLYGLCMANMFGWRSGASKDDEALQEIRKLKEQIGIEDS